MITGVGVLCPIGIGRHAVWRAIEHGQSGIRRLGRFDTSALPVRIGGEVLDFEPKRLVTQRKSLKVMARDAQLGVAGSVLACQDAGIISGTVDPAVLGWFWERTAFAERLRTARSRTASALSQDSSSSAAGREEGFPAMFPLSFPHGSAQYDRVAHLDIAHDARGPNNTIHHGEVSSLLAVIEATRVIERGWADAMIAGGASSQMHPTDWVRHCLSGRLSTRQGDPASVMRPFDADRDGEAWGEGGAAFVLETRQHAEARGATILARVIGSATTFEPSVVQRTSGSGLRRAIVLALAQSRVRSGEVAYIKAHGLSTVEDDSVEARAIRDVLPSVPVTAPKSYFGNLGAARRRGGNGRKRTGVPSRRRPSHAQFLPVGSSLSGRSPSRAAGPQKVSRSSDQLDRIRSKRGFGDRAELKTANSWQGYDQGPV